MSKDSNNQPHGDVAQWLEQSAHNRLVVGSIPTIPTNEFHDENSTVMKYGYRKSINLPFAEALDKVKAELKGKGFGILSEIDIKATLKMKLDVDYSNYVILGACNPPNAYEALQAEQEVGLLLPCNVILYETNETKVYVSTILPTVAMGIVKNEALAEIAKVIEEKLRAVIDNASK